MKKILTFLLAMVLLVGCQASDNAKYTGRYALLHKENCTYLVVNWEYPVDDFNFSTFDVDTSNLNAYIDESAPTDGPGLILNSLLGNFGYNRSFIQVSPIHIYEDDISKIIRKNIKIYLSINDQNGNNYYVRLKYDKSIKE